MSTKRLRLAGAIALMGLVLTSCGGGTTEDAVPSEGIGVHGAWTIDVINPDGTVDKQIDFTNALADTGDDWIADVFAGSVTPGNWRISALAAAAGSPCIGLGDVTTACSIDPPDLQVSVNDAGGAFGSVLNLTGSFVADVDGVIGQVRSANYTCASSVSPDDCTTGNFNGVTATTFPEQAVAAGQTVQISVELSFGTLP